MNPSNIDYYADKGSKDSNWYQTHTEFFIQLYGAQYLPLVTSLFAATSINSSLKSNIRLFRKAWHEIQNDLPFSNYLPVMRGQLDRIRAGQPLSGRKIQNFAEAMHGNEQVVVVDIWVLRAFELNRQYGRLQPGGNTRKRESGASDKDYDTIERWIKEKAYRVGVAPRDYTAMIWSGIRSTVSRETETQYINILWQQTYNMYEVRNTS